ncbi:hypothetical protein DENIS_3855 [Desulfonema ishimotonii]|uniref:Uncharacterized protein n=1 Tax=Desulfonema ishimotonii TaxID=45657 RepID=A0A401G0X7_9BACT|nr:hypothetical protein DENIS_3855 [Desulfonema ishimotonii]
MGPVWDRETGFCPRGRDGAEFPGFSEIFCETGASAILAGETGACICKRTSVGSEGTAQGGTGLDFFRLADYQKGVKYFCLVVCPDEYPSG